MTLRRNRAVKCGRSRFRSRFPVLLLQTSSLHHHTRYQLLLLGSILQDCDLFVSHLTWCFYFIAYFIFIFSLKKESLYSTQIFSLVGIKRKRSKSTSMVDEVRQWYGCFFIEGIESTHPSNHAMLLKHLGSWAFSHIGVHWPFQTINNNPEWTVAFFGCFCRCCFSLTSLSISCCLLDLGLSECAFYYWSMQGLLLSSIRLFLLPCWILRPYSLVIFDQPQNSQRNYAVFAQ